LKFVLFYHSLVSDWNHGNAHFLRGIATELLNRGHVVEVFEPRNSWSRENLTRDHGRKPVDEFRRRFPGLRSARYTLRRLDLDAALDDADVVIVHEWNDPELVRRVGRHSAGRRSYRLFFHDTHHRALSEAKEMAQYDLSEYDGVLAYGKVLRDIYLDRGWASRAWTWHEAADTTLFQPRPGRQTEGDVVWIGNWGDEERTAALHRFLIDPVRELRLTARIHGVRYPRHALTALRRAKIEYGGWLPNWRVPEVFSRYRLTVHVPRRPYVRKLRGIPTIRPFEAMACGIPLISAPWDDAEGLFTAGQDYLVAASEAGMRKQMRAVLSDRDLAESLVSNALDTIRKRHTCAHRVDELLAIARSAGLNRRRTSPRKRMATS
jgi:spore maturation protein CgeB